MNQSQALHEFRKQCQKYYICYAFSSLGLKERADKFVRLNPDRSKNAHVGTGHPDYGQWHGSMNIGDLIDSSQKNGDFPNQIAKSFICAIYSLWDELYRHEIAIENGCKQKQVMSDLMGDLRQIRNCVIHKKSKITNEQGKIKELKWVLQPGEIVISENMFQTLINQINDMKVVINN